MSNQVPEAFKLPEPTQIKFGNVDLSQRAAKLALGQPSRGKNTVYNETSHPTTHQGEIMAENTQTPEPTQPEVEETPAPRLQTFVNTHPRAAKYVAFAGAAATAAGAVLFAKTLKANRNHLDAAADHAKEALNELSTSVSPQDPEA